LKNKNEKNAEMWQPGLGPKELANRLAPGALAVVLPSADNKHAHLGHLTGHIQNQLDIHYTNLLDCNGPFYLWNVFFFCIKMQFKYFHPILVDMSRGHRRIKYWFPEYHSKHSDYLVHRKVGRNRKAREVQFEHFNVKKIMPPCCTAPQGLSIVLAVHLAVKEHVDQVVDKFAYNLNKIQHLFNNFQIYKRRFTANATNECVGPVLSRHTICIRWTYRLIRWRAIHLPIIFQLTFTQFII
jgi:hypothetical protein